MPQAKILKGLAGNGYTWNAGSVQDLPEEVLERFVAAGIAERLDDGGGKSAAPKAKRARKATRKAPEER
jgi:hypothetical protein